jgi:glycosyltransferase involved in cell wall biosynthesis
MNNTKYSVLMSIYHKEKLDFFIKSVESMLRQSIKPDEIVIVKDGPLTPELDQAINKYENQDPRLFTIVPLEKNLGLGLALNEGLKKCRNDLVARMDTDDISLENRCELQLKEFEKNPMLSICGTMIDEFYDTPENIVTSRIVPLLHDDIVKFGRRRSPFNHVTVMFKKDDVLSCEGGYHDVHRKEDIDLFVRMVNQGCLGININKSLVLVRSNKDNFERRKSWPNCKSYIKVIYNFWKKGYSSTTDLIVVVIGQMVMFLSPVWMLKILSNRILRGKVK